MSNGGKKGDIRAADFSISVLRWDSDGQHRDVFSVISCIRKGCMTEWGSHGVLGHRGGKLIIGICEPAGRAFWCQNYVMDLMIKLSSIELAQ